jgi:CO/xanthine dehydrogenase Mo-binding subunit
MEATVKALAVGRTETRAFADCQVTFAFESMMDELAQRLGIDPLALHRLNALLPGDTHCADGVLTTSIGIADCLDLLAAHPLWLERANRKAAPHD